MYAKPKNAHNEKLWSPSRLLYAVIAAGLVLFFGAGSAFAVSTFVTQQGGTGTTSPSGILYGDNGATGHVNTVTIGSNLTFSGGTLSATGGGSSFGYPFTANATTTVITFSNGLSTPQLTNLTTNGFVQTSGGNGTLTSAALTSGNITTALGFTPYNNTNPSAFISNATGLISQGTNVTITGSGTSGSPYVINASASGGSGTVGTSSSETANQFPFWTTTNGTPALLSGTSNLFRNGNNIGIGSSSPQSLLTVGNGGTLATSTIVSDLVVGLNGTTTPAFQVLGSITNAANGVEVVPSAAGSGVSILTTSTGANDALNLGSKGTSNVNLLVNGVQTLTAGNTQINIIPGNQSKGNVSTVQWLFQQASAITTAANPRFLFTGGADTSLTAATEATDWYANMGQSRGHLAGAITVQRDFRITPSTHTFTAGTTIANSTIASTTGFSIDSPPLQGPIVNFTNVQAEYIGGGVYTAASTTNATGLVVQAPSGASINNAALFLGNVGIGTTTPSSLLTVGTGGSLSTTTLISDLAVGLNGTTSPAFQVLGNIANAATGISITPAAAAGGVFLNVTSSGANEALNISPKGSGGVTIGNGAGGNTVIKSAVGNAFTVGSANFSSAVNPSGTAATVRWGFTGAADTALTASVEAPSTYFNLGQTRTHSTGALTLQRDFRITGSTHAFVGASTIGTAAAFSVDGPDSGGANGTISTSTGLYIPSAVVANVTTADSIYAEAPSGATNNNAAVLIGKVGVSSSTPTYGLSVGSQATPASIISSEYQPATSTSQTVDWSQGNQQLIRMGAAAMAVSFSNASPGATLRLVVCNPLGSAGALTFTGVDWSGGVAPTQTTTASQCDVWSFLDTGATSTPKILGAQSAGYP